VASTKKVSPEQVREGPSPLMVCAYEDEDKCGKIAIEGALSLKEFQSRLGDIPKSEHIVFY